MPKIRVPTPEIVQRDASTSLLEQVHHMACRVEILDERSFAQLDLDAMQWQSGSWRRWRQEHIVRELTNLRRRDVEGEEQFIRPADSILRYLVQQGCRDST